MKIFRMLAVSFSLYSKVPMPRFEWRDEDMAHSLLFFPWVGAVCGLLMYGADKLLSPYCDALLRAILLLLIPVLVSGGFHLDGFMDTRDALASYAEREKNLQILSDPHVGAFAVIGLVCLMTAMFAALYVICTEGGSMCVAGGAFVISRSLSALTSLHFKKAKDKGMLKAETKGAGRIVSVFVTLWMLMAAALMLYADTPRAALVLAGFAAALPLYHRRMMKEFGGVSGDTAGYFVWCSELAACVIYAVTLKLKFI